MFARVIVVLASLAAVCSAKLYSEDAVQQKQLWDAFKAEFAKNYDTMEVESRRFYHFLENLKVADARNVGELKAGGSAIHGITRFSDLSQSEFEATMLTSDESFKTGGAEVAVIDTQPNTASGLIDWTGKYTTDVKDQGYCGSCWAFSATEQIESDAIRTLGFSTSYLLSPQQITSCDTTSSGCNGGWTEHAYNYVKRAGGIETNSDYPYTSYQGTTGICKASSSKYVVKVSSYSTIKGESSMASYVQSKGPLSVCIDASTWNSYRGGIVTSCGKRVNHCVQAVGVDASTGGYWKVRNSWGKSWGESGYIRLAYGKDTCAITNDPTYVTVSK